MVIYYLPKTGRLNLVQKVDKDQTYHNRQVMLAANIPTISYYPKIRCILIEGININQQITVASYNVWSDSFLANFQILQKVMKKNGIHQKFHMFSNCITLVHLQMSVILNQWPTHHNLYLGSESNQAFVKIVFHSLVQKELRSLSPSP